MKTAKDEAKLLATMRRVQSTATFALISCFVTLWFAGQPAASGFSLAAIQPQPNSGLPLGAISGLIGFCLLNALFSAAVTALEMLRPLHVRHISEKEPRRGERLQNLIDSRTRYVAACRLGNHASLLAMVFFAFLIAPNLAFRLEWVGYGDILVAALIILIPAGILNLILELIPKSYAALHPHGVATTLYPFIVMGGIVFWLPETFVTRVANAITASFGGKASFALENQTEEEIKTLVESAEETGEIEKDERELLHSVFEFSDTVAREVMTPRVDMDAVPVSSEPGQLVKLIDESGHSRIPLYEETDDQIVGIVHAKDLFLAMLGGEEVNLRELMRAPLFVPENMSLHELLAQMRTTRSQFAVVQDGFGGTSGIVTIEDIVEELVGDIVDEYDEEEAVVEKVESGWIVEGKTHIDDVNELVGCEFESDEFDTVGGFVFGLFGRTPMVNESIEFDDYRFTVVETDGRRIAKLQIEHTEQPLPVYFEEEQV